MKAEIQSITPQGSNYLMIIKFTDPEKKKPDETATLLLKNISGIEEVRSRIDNTEKKW